MKRPLVINDLPIFDDILSQTSDEAKHNATLLACIGQACIDLKHAIHYMESRSYQMPANGMERPLSLVRKALKELEVKP